MDAGNCQKDLKKFSKEEGKKGWGGGGGGNPALCFTGLVPLRPWKAPVG